MALRERGRRFCIRLKLALRHPTAADWNRYKRRKAIKGQR